MKYYTKTYENLTFDNVHRYKFELLLSKEFLIFSHLYFYNNAGNDTENEFKTELIIEEGDFNNV